MKLNNQEIKKPSPVLGMPKEFFEEIKGKPIKLFIKGNLAGGFDEIVIRTNLPPGILGHVIEFRKGWILTDALSGAFWSELKENGFTLPNSPVMIKPFWVAGFSVSKPTVKEEGKQKAVLGIAWVNHLIGEVKEVDKIEQAIKDFGEIKNLPGEGG